MKTVEKVGDEVSIIALPAEEVLIGDYIVIEDEERNGRLVVQVYDERYLDHAGIVEDMVRDEVMKASADGVESDPLQINTISYLIRDIRLLKCKIRGSVDGDRFTSNVSWLPSRVRTRIRKMSISELMRLAGQSGSRKIVMGETGDREMLHISAESLDGRLNIVTGRKESGKSHLAKLLATELVKYGAYVFIFDLNNEYGGLAWNRDGSPSSNAEKSIILSPGGSLVFSLRYLGLSSI
ncbi:MAG: helicase HerA domain-containing protein, partial [Nitrososphaerales archaeon]